MRRGAVIGAAFVVAYYLADAPWLNDWLWITTGDPVGFHLLRSLILFSVGFLAEVVTPSDR